MRQSVRSFFVVAALLLSIAGDVLAMQPGIEELSIAELNVALAKGSLSSEQLVRRSLARIEAYDAAGPHLNAILALNPAALTTARQLDKERRVSGARSALHGIPVVIKDNIDTADLPTTGGSVFLKGSRPPDDAAVVRKLREAGAIVLAKLNMSEFALGDAYSSLGGQMRNPHDPMRSPAGSSGGTGAAIAAAYAPLGLGTDTGGSIRAPAAANGIVGLKPTYELISRDGVIPLAATLDTVGPMARHVSDIAIALDILVDANPSGAKQNYSSQLNSQALKGVRIGVIRNFVGSDRAIAWTLDAAVVAMRSAGATLVDTEFPAWLMGDELQEYYSAIVTPEFATGLPTYLDTLQASYPRTLQQLVTQAERFFASNETKGGPNPQRWASMKRQAGSPGLDDYRYQAVRSHALPLVRSVVEGVMKANAVDFLIYPTADRVAPLITGSAYSGEGRPFADCIANLSGLPELAVPAGFSGEGLPISLSFLGKPYSEAQLLAVGFSFEQATHALRLPRHTPPLGARVRSP